VTEYYQLLRRDLTGNLPAPQWPQAIRLEPYRDELAPDIHALLRLTEDQGGGRVANLAQWRQSFFTDAEFDPALCLVVSRADCVLGVAHCWTSAFIKNLSVHPDAQGQGLGRALLLHAFAVFKQRGEPCADLKVRESNQRARNLYESVGMRFVLRDVVPDV